MKKIITVFLFCAAAGSLFSQTDTAAKTGTKVIFFGANRTKEEKNYNSSAIKLGLADIASGLYGLHFEHELSDVFSIQAGAGLTSRNYMEGLVYDAFKDNAQVIFGSPTYMGPLHPGATITNQGNDIWNFDTRTSSIGYFIAIQPKFFLTEEGFDGSYFGLNFQYRHYGFSAQNVDTTATGSATSSANGVRYITSNPLSEYQNETIIAISFGHQWTGEKTIVEESFSIGVRNISGQRRDLWNSNWSDNSGNYYSANFAQLSSYTTSQFYMDFTIKIGLWWSNKK